MFHIDTNREWRDNDRRLFGVKKEILEVGRPRWKSWVQTLSDIIVNAATWKASDSVGKGEAIRRDQLGGHVDVKVIEAGCYAIRIEFLQDNVVGSDSILGRNDDGTTLKCWCLKANEAHHFKYHGAGEAAGGATVPYDEPDRDELDPVHGTWPTYAGAFDNVLNPYILASVFRCPGQCDETGKCTPSLISLLGDPLKDDHTSALRPHGITIYNGEGVQHGLNLVGSAISLLGGLVSKLGG